MRLCCDCSIALSALSWLAAWFDGTADPIDGKLMMIIACIGVVFNIVSANCRDRQPSPRCGKELQTRASIRKQQPTRRAGSQLTPCHVTSCHGGCRC